MAGTSRRHGRIKDGSTLTDTSPDEIERQHSISLGLACAEWMDTKINLLDTPGYLEYLGEVVAALSVAVSTRLPMLANFVISFSIYVLGHLTPLLVQSKANEFEIVRFFGRLIATIFPVLEYYDIQAGIAGGANVPLDYLAWMLLYTLLYSGIAMLLALILFEDRDLA